MLTAENPDTTPRYYVQRGRTVIHGTPAPGGRIARTKFGPGDEIPAGLLAPDEIARMLANKTISHRPPVLTITPAAANNPAGVGVVNPQALELNAQGPRY